MEHRSWSLRRQYAARDSWLLAWELFQESFGFSENSVLLTCYLRELVEFSRRLVEAAGRRRSAQLRKPQRGQTLLLGTGSSDVASHCTEKLRRGRLVSTV